MVRQANTASGIVETMTTLERAIEFAAKAHAGQLDKGGQPYILHPLRVMLTVVGGMHERMAAVLHDVVEDSSLTLADLRAAGFPNEVVDAVDALTKQEGESRLSAAGRAVMNPVARAVKIADVTDNMNPSRLQVLTERDEARLQEYRQVLSLLRDGAQP